MHLHRISERAVVDDPKRKPFTGSRVNFTEKNIFAFCQAQDLAPVSSKETQEGNRVSANIDKFDKKPSEEEEQSGDSSSDRTNEEDFLRYISSGTAMAQFTVDQFHQLIRVLRQGTGPLKTVSTKDLPHFRGFLTEDCEDFFFKKYEGCAEMG